MTILGFFLYIIQNTCLYLSSTDIKKNRIKKVMKNKGYEFRGGEMLHQDKDELF